MEQRDAHRGEIALLFAPKFLALSTQKVTNYLGFRPIYPAIEGGGGI